MKLRNVEFGSVFNASGARNFFGHDKWWFHKRLKHVGLTYEGCTLVTKTTTLEPRAGNMPLKPGTTTPFERVPKSIVVKPLSKVVLNKVGLSGPGLDWLLKEGSWQANKKPFVISVMAIGKTKDDRLREYYEMASRISKHMVDATSAFAVQINFSCPNVGHEQSEMVDEVFEALAIFSNKLPNTPLVVKFNALLEIDKAVAIGRHERCDALVMGNTIPWGKLPDKIDWKGIFGSNTSPLRGMGGDDGGGGLSGEPLLPIHVDWIKAACAAGIKKPIIACGGILHVQDVRWLKEAGASAIEVGSASILRPWRVQSIIDEGRRVFG